MPTIDRPTYNETPEAEAPRAARRWSWPWRDGSLDESPELKPRRFQAEWFFVAILIAVPLLVALFGMLGHMFGGVAEQPHPR